MNGFFTFHLRINMSRKSASLSEQIRIIIRRGSHQGRPHDPVHTEWPSASQYARYVGCTPQAISKFTNRESKGMGFELLDPLAFLCGVHPVANNVERRRRLRDADRWLWSPSLRKKYPEIITYLLTVAQNVWSRGTKVPARKANAKSCSTPKSP